LRLATFVFDTARFAAARVGEAFFFARVTAVRLAEDRLTEDRRPAAFRLAVERVLVAFFFFLFAARLATPASG